MVNVAVFRTRDELGAGRLTNATQTRRDEARINGIDASACRLKAVHPTADNAGHALFFEFDTILCTLEKCTSS